MSSSAGTVKLCAKCGLERPHRKRGDSAAPRRYCVKCTAVESKEWRQKNWQRRKLNDAWRLLHRRCYDTRHPSYKRYGFKGIKVSPRWHGREGFLRFAKDMGLPPSPGHVVDRKDSKKGYSKRNCRWSTRQANDDNRCTTLWLEALEPTSQKVFKLTTRAWAEIAGVEPDLIRSRHRRGWSDQESIFGRPEVEATEIPDTSPVPF